ncbi:hypothetical protein GQ457_12G014300 [Hibiscus cannabinus]
MEKAFDRVEWPFLKAVMLRLGFAPSWVDLIMRCVSFVSSRVHVRGALSEAFRPQRGLRQGDPLSPFLFLFCMEGLSAALVAAQHEGRLPGVCATRLGAIGVIARDSSGAVLGGFAKPVPVHGPASTVEFSALFAGLEFSIANGWPSALIESDAAVLVNKLHRPTVDLSLLGDLLAPFRALLAASDGCLRVGFASRSANSAAHALASWACHNDNVLSFSSVCPELISRIVLDDLSSSF